MADETVDLRIVTCDIIDANGKQFKHSFIFNMEEPEEEEVESLDSGEEGEETPEAVVLSTEERLLIEAKQSVSKVALIKSPYSLGVAGIFKLEIEELPA